MEIYSGDNSKELIGFDIKYKENTKGIYSFNGIVPFSLDFIAEDNKRYFFLKKGDVQGEAEGKFTYRVAEENSKGKLFVIPNNSIPLKIFNFTEEGQERSYIGSFEIFDRIAFIVAYFNKYDLLFRDLDINSFSISSGEKDWIKLIPGSFRLYEDTHNPQDFKGFLEKIRLIDPENKSTKLRDFFISKYKKYHGV